MKEWLSEYWYYLIFLALSIVLAVVAVTMAAKASRKRRALFLREEANIKRLVALKEKFKPVTKEAIDSADDEELLEGIALSYQLKLQKEEKQEELFETFNDDVKDIYALDVFVQDKTSEEFFSQNGVILKDRILSALEKIGMKAFAEELRPIYDMYDNSNEEVSYDINKIRSFDEKMTADGIISDIKLRSAAYIRENYKSFEN